MNFSKLAHKLKNPIQVQKFLDSFEYNKKETMYSAFTAFQKKSAHCMEGAFLAAALCEPIGYPPVVLSLESHDGLDHVVFVCQKNSKWGSVAVSRDRGLRGRLPIFRGIRDLVWSYHAPYIDLTGRITAYQVLHLDETQTDWRFSKTHVWEAEKYLIQLKHKKLKSSYQKYLEIKRAYVKNGPLMSGKGWL